MLSVYLSGFEEKQTLKILSCMKQMNQLRKEDQAVRFSMEYSCETHDEMKRMVEKMTGISVIFIHVKGTTPEDIEEAVHLGNLCTQSNRDHYLVYVLPTPLILTELAPYIFNISSVLLYPCDEEDILRSLNKIVEDYRLLSLEDENGKSPFVSLKYLGSVVRVVPNEIQYVEARDKKLEIHRQNRPLSIYENMDNMKNKLGNRFFHCHRSFLVNCDAIEKIDLPRMEISLFDGTRIPISRSYRSQAVALAEAMMKA